VEVLNMGEEKRIGNRVVRLIRGDITDLEVEAFVFDITEDLKLGSGYGGAIAQRGGPAVQKELDGFGRLPVGEALITSAGNMKAKFIVHVNGPKFHEPDTEGKLRRAVTAALTVAAQKGIKQIAFPLIGTGLYQVPLELSARVLMETITAHLQGDTCIEEVLLVALDSREWAPLAAHFLKGANHAAA
jgi:O-acetyl-ADP-ribose deacetylase (regulator of RNase III)